MKMEYKLLGNGSAVILTRQPEIVYDELYITFSGAPSDATAIIETSGDSLYRKLSEGTCAVPANKLRGEVKITVAILDGTTPPKRWTCEELKAEALRDGGILVCPNDLNLPQTIFDLRIENQEIREENATIKGELAAIKKRLNEIMEAYDFT